MIDRDRRTDTDKFLVFSLKLAKYLEGNGYQIIHTRPDLKDTNRDVFLFENTPQLRQTIDTYLS